VTLTIPPQQWAWEFIGIDTEATYQDERPLLIPNTAETRE
jgi:hypothetical protein